MFTYRKRLADIGHLNLFGKDPLYPCIETKAFISRFHVSDNIGYQDEHLATGEGAIRWDEILEYSRSFYSGTGTPEVLLADKQASIKSKTTIKMQINKIGANVKI